MYFRISWDTDFDTLMMHLWSKYGKELFTLDGIGEQMDLNKFSKNFFNSNGPSADVSVDANANVVAKTGIEYNFELPKPLKRYNSYFLLWKELKKAYGLETANDIIEAQLTGDIYINDFTDIASPYSYHPGTTILVKDGRKVRMMTLEELFFENMAYVVKKEDWEEADLKPLELEVYEDRKWVALERVVRHKNKKKMYRFETKKGTVFSVTEDHPCILADGSEKFASDVEIGDEILGCDVASANVVQNAMDVDFNRAYLTGALIGDGSLNSTTLTLHQKNILESSYMEHIEKLYDNITTGKVDDVDLVYSVDFGHREDALWHAVNIGTRAFNKRLPSDCLLWKTDALKALVAGLIDTDGTVNKHTGVVDIRVISLGMVQQIAEIATRIGMNRVRTSCVAPARGKNRIDQLQPMYRVSFSIPDENDSIVEMSYKLKDHVDVLFKKRAVDGRFETMHVLKKEEVDFNDKYVYDITTSSGRFYTNGIIGHNCFNYSTNDIAFNGLDSISKRIRVFPPKSLDTFLRQVEQFVVVAANSTLGATGFADLLLVASRYVDLLLETGMDGHTMIGNPEQYIKERLTAFVYTVNWEFRGNQSAFTNISLYDDTFLDSLCPDYNAKKETVKLLQKIYVEVMNEELARSPITFPVTTACFCKEEDGSIKDKEFLDFIANANLEYGWINIYNGDTSTLSSCCRLRSNKDNPYFNSFGAGSTKIGSLGVVTANLPRIAYKAKGDVDKFMEGLEEIYAVAAKINACKRRLVRKRIELGAAPLYTQGYMDLSKQYSTFGVVGINEAVQLLGKDILTEDGQNLVLKILKNINKWIDRAEAQYKAPHNVEQVPAETSAIKLASKDKMLGYDIGVPLYSNQFIPLIVKADMLDRLKLQGLFDRHLSGGAIAHINVGEKIKDPKVMVSLMEYAAKCGVVYWAINYLLNCCEEKHLWVGGETCPTCGRPCVNHMTRVVGFLTTVANWHPVRRTFDFPQRQFYTDEVEHEAIESAKEKSVA